VGACGGLLGGGTGGVGRRGDGGVRAGERGGAGGVALRLEALGGQVGVAGAVGGAQVGEEGGEGWGVRHEGLLGLVADGGVEAQAPELCEGVVGVEARGEVGGGPDRVVLGGHVRPASARMRRASRVSCTAAVPRAVVTLAVA